MDFTKIDRPLIYKQRQDFREFLPKSSICGTALEKEYLDKLLERPFMQEVDDVAKMVTTIFNNAFYICTLIKMEEYPQIYHKVYRQIAINGNGRNILWVNHVMPATMALVYSLLVRDEYKNTAFIKKLYNFFSNWDQHGASEGKDDFYMLVIYTNPANISEKDRLYFPKFAHCDIFEALDAEYVDELASNIDYVLQEIRGTGDKSKISQGLHTLKQIFDEETTLLQDTSYFIPDIHDYITAIEKLKEAFAQEGLVWTEIPEDESDSEEAPETPSAEATPLPVEPEQKPEAACAAEIAALNEEISSLKETIKTFQQRQSLMCKNKTQRGGMQMGLTPEQSIVFGMYMARRLGITFTNKKELAPLLNGLFGWGISSLSQRICSHIPEDDELYVADIFGKYSKEVAKEICSKWSEDRLSSESPHE